MPWGRVEVLGIYGRPEGIHVPAQNAAGVIEGEEQAPAAGGRNGMVHGVVGIRRRDVAGPDPGQRIRSGHAAEIDVLEVIVGGRGQRFYVGDVEAVSDSDLRETPPQMGARGNRKPVAVLDVVQQVTRAQLVIQRDQVRPRQNRGLAALVEIEPAQIDHEAELNRPVQEIRLGEPQPDGPHTGAELRIEGQRFAQPEEVVGGVVEPHEAARDAGNAAVQPDGVFAALLHLEGNVHGIRLRIALDVGGVFLLQHFEIAELVEPQNAVIP